MVHVVYCDDAGKAGDRTLDRILAGTKTMIVRGAAGRKIPHSRVDIGQALYFMQKGSLAISARATVTDVQNYVKLTEDEINATFDQNAARLALTPKQRERWHKNAFAWSALRMRRPSTRRFRLISSPTWTIG